ncbi:KTSC domain-containing protein [Intestinibacter sp.]|uniref:KTSC domain-containing protein n=1 Tax=Intestinibacter sp. TaxID=1965304 RepID=UPI002A7567EA|nr:KTSC domain-containing protein [Intestinibacter sp.]MDY2736877.1 KTSC domain-containing protein [Intestinibacter sp.]
MKVKSSTIAEIDREVVNEKLFLKVIFTNGREYLYEEVPADVYEKFLMADSKGKYLHENIIGKYNYSRIK